MLLKPKTSKEVEDGAWQDKASGARLAFGVAGMQGWRLRMEDAHLAKPDFDRGRGLGLFGVFDGHGGAAVAKVAAARLPGILREQQAFKDGLYSEALTACFIQMDVYLDSPAGRKEVIEVAAQHPPSDEEGPARDSDDDSDEDSGLARMALADMLAEEGGEEEMQENDESEDDDDDATTMKMMQSGDDGQPSTYNMWVAGSGPDCMGTTAVVALVRHGKDGEIFVANAGDSRCVLSNRGKAVDLSEDHKPSLKGETARIKKAGGFVTDLDVGGRVDGNLSLSRAFGDFAYKKQKNLKYTEQRIICVPEVSHRKLLPDDNFIVLGCDGIWEKASSQDVVEFVSKLGVGKKPAAAKSSELSTACGLFLDKNLARSPGSDMGLGCDNMTLMAVDLLGSNGHATDVVSKPKATAAARQSVGSVGVCRRISKGLPLRISRSPAAKRRELLVRQRWRNQKRLVPRR